MKKVLSLALALVLTFALAIPAFAAEVELSEGPIAPDASFTGTDNSTDVIYNVDGSYTISVPATIEIDYVADNSQEAGTPTYDSVSVQTLAATDVMLPYGKKLQVVLEGATADNGITGFNVIAQNAGVTVDTIPYTVTSAGVALTSGTTSALTIQPTGVRADADDRGLMDGDAVELILTTTVKPKYNAAYKGTITFAVSVVDAGTP